MQTWPTHPASRRLAAPANIYDREIVAALRAGSEEALEQTIAKYRSQIYSVAFRLTGNHHDAEEIVQETFLRAFRGALQFRGDASLATWLYTIAANLARNRYWYWRRRKRHEVLSLDAPARPGDEATLAEVLALEDCATGTQSEQDEFARQIERGMARLSERDQLILYLRVEQRAPYDEIASRLTIPMGTVKSRLARARDRLRASIRDEMGAEAAVMPKAS